MIDFMMASGFIDLAFNEFVPRYNVTWNVNEYNSFWRGEKKMDYSVNSLYEGMSGKNSDIHCSSENEWEKIM